MPVEYCGLDFGTSNSTLALIRDGRPVLCPLEGEDVTLPSAVFFDFEDHKVRYGRDGIRAYVEGSEGRLLRGLKSVLGSPLINETTLVQRKRVEMRAIIGMFVRHLKAAASRETVRRGGAGELDSVVLGRPVRFVDDDDSADRVAESELVSIVKAQGFRHVETQLEPIAAALAYEQSLDREELCLTVDLGGGTSDFVIARLSPERAKKPDRTADILGRSGVHVGGTDFDRRLSIDRAMPHLGYNVRLGPKRLRVPAHLFHDLATWHKIPFLYTSQNLAYLRSVAPSANHPELLERLIEVMTRRKGHQIAGEVEAAKIALSEAAETEFFLPLTPIIDVPVTRADLARAVHDDTTRIIEAIDRCCRGAALPAARLQSVFLTGGSTGIPAVRRRILAHLPKARLVEGDRFGSVGLGLAIDAERRFGRA
jgi:hypothetical chaperone protein